MQVAALGREDPWRREWLPTPVFLPGASDGQRSLAGYSPWGCREPDTTEQLNNNDKGHASFFTTSSNRATFSPFRWTLCWGFLACGLRNHIHPLPLLTVRSWGGALHTEALDPEAQLSPRKPGQVVRLALHPPTPASTPAPAQPEGWGGHLLIMRQPGAQGSQVI